MAKGSRKRAARYAKDQSGCMWGLVNIFDFRHGSPSQKLLADKKRGSRRVSGPAIPSDELKKLENSCRFDNDSNASEQCEATMSSQLSVKELMEGEMFEQCRNSDLDPKHTASDQRSHGWKKHWRTNKQSFDLNAAHVVSEKPTHRKHKSLGSLDVNGMVAELCSQIHAKDVDCLGHGETSKDTPATPMEDPSVTEAKMGEATRVFISHFVDGKNAKEGIIQPSEELSDALRVLNSNRDMFLKLLQDPNSQLMKHIQKLEDHWVSADENSSVQAGSELLEQGKSKHQSFFWRKLKGRDRNLSKKSDPQDLSMIVVLKPLVGLKSSQDTVGEDQSKRASSYFSFTQFTRKLKMAIRKEQTEKAAGGENLAMPSSSRDHFFVERLPKSAINGKKGEKLGQSNETNSTPEQRVSNIYAEAKKHLAEIVGSGDADVDHFSNQVSNSLGRILSYSKYGSSNICSTDYDRRDGLLAPCVDSRGGEDIKDEQVLEEKVCHEGLATGSCIAKETEDIEVPKDKCNASDSAVSDIHVEDGAEIKNPDDMELEKQISSDTLPSEPCSSFARGNGQDEETPKDSEEEQPMCFNLDASSSPSGPPSACSITEDFEDPDATTDRSERPSPISVLEPIFKEDDISPPSVKSLLVAEFIQPRQIKFENQIPPAAHSRIWEEEKNSVFEFVNVVVTASGLTQHQLLERFLFSEHLLDPSLYYQVEYLPDLLCHDPKLVFDLVDEVLVDICGRDFDGIPSFYEPYLQLKSKRTKNISDNIFEGVDLYLQSEHKQHTLDQTVAKDFSKSWAWMDLRLDSEAIGIEMDEEIFEELLEDAVMSLVKKIAEAEIRIEI